MREIQTGAANLNILWCDDDFYVQKWGNKEFIEEATSINLNQNTHFIPKISTSIAMAFLESQFG